MTETSIQSQPASPISRCITIVGDRQIAERHNVYDVWQLWKTASGYEIRTIRNIKNPDAVQIRSVSDEEAESFSLEAARERAKWEEINKAHLTLASFLGGDDLYRELQLMPDDSFRIVVSDVCSDDICQYEILPADITRVAKMFRNAAEYEKKQKELEQQRHCTRCPSCGDTGKWEFEVNGPRIVHEGLGEKRRFCINPNHAQAAECVVCNKIGIKCVHNDRDEYLHGGDGGYVHHTVTYINQQSASDAQKKEPVPLFLT